jgi:N-acyl homoserine lactone hydrolase
VINTTLQRLYLLQVVTTPILPAGMANAVCYLVQTNDGKQILIDSGSPAEYQPPPGVPAAEQEKHVTEQLADLDLCPDDINMVICTHFDVDHAGYHDAFPKAQFIVQREHYELARSGHPRFATSRPHWDHPALQYRLIDGDTELLLGLTLLKTNGHAPGHQSVLRGARQGSRGLGHQRPATGMSSTIGISSVASRSKLAGSAGRYNLRMRILLGANT